MGKFEKIFVNSKRHAKGNIRVIEQLFPYLDLKGIENVLEIGCGVGMLCDYLSQMYDMNVVGIDVDPEQIKIAKKHYSNNRKLSFSVKTASNLLFDNSSFDMILSFKVLHHISDWEIVLKEVNRVLRSNGIFVFSDFSYAPFCKKILKPFGKNYGLYTIDDIVRNLDGLDMQVIYQNKSMPFIFSRYDILFRREKEKIG
jgi:ubiquinone/menaquinone biosynthesis C-methylase UbiE